MLTLDGRHAAEYAMRRRSTLVGTSGPALKKQATQHFQDDHSLQASHDKTHPIC
jgi:glutamate decarboxylase